MASDIAYDLVAKGRARTAATSMETAPGGSPLFWGSKRAFDIIVSLALLPLILVAGAMLLLLNPIFNQGPLMYRQPRMGRGGAKIDTLKFRSMRAATGKTRGADDPIERDRITPLGQIIRGFRIDELPQILAVLKGEMSLIGPRPDTYEFASVYVEEIPAYRARYRVRPGISGLAQVTQGYTEGVAATRAKAAIDNTYIESAGWGLELAIIWRTFVTVFTKRGH